MVKVLLNAGHVHLLISGLLTRLFTDVSLLLLPWMHLCLKMCSLKNRTLLGNWTGWLPVEEKPFWAFLCTEQTPYNGKHEFILWADVPHWGVAKAASKTQVEVPIRASGFYRLLNQMRPQSLCIVQASNAFSFDIYVLKPQRSWFFFFFVAAGTRNNGVPYVSLI